MGCVCRGSRPRHVTAVENVTGRLTKAAPLTSVPLGAVFGALAGFIGQWASGGHRDFSSIRSLEADEYERSRSTAACTRKPCG